MLLHEILYLCRVQGHVKQPKRGDAAVKTVATTVLQGLPLPDRVDGRATPGASTAKGEIGDVVPEGEGGEEGEEGEEKRRGDQYGALQRLVTNIHLGRITWTRQRYRRRKRVWYH